MSMKCRTWYALKFKRSFYTSDQRDGYYIKKEKRKRMCAELRNPCNILSCCVYIDCLKCFRNKPQKTKQNICLISFKKNVHKLTRVTDFFVFFFPSLTILSGGAREWQGRTPPRLSENFFISMQFSEKSWKITGLSTPLEWVPPLWKILDQPLIF